jgi:hypothetical protein
MADKKYIKKMNMPVDGTNTDLYIKDAEAVSSINGYSNEQINAGTVTFADTPITKDELINLFPEKSN